jgi:hypothetical protein
MMNIKQLGRRFPAPARAALKATLVRPYYRARHLWPAWRFLNAPARRRYERDGVALSPVERRVVEDFRRDGIAVTSLDELFPGEGWLAVFQEYFAAHRAEAAVVERKSFYIDLWDSNRTLMSPENPFVRFALNPRVVNIVNAYLRMWAHCHGLRVVGTEVVPEGSAARQSQRWHRDPEDKMMCKTFLYLNDVDTETGPFIYARGSHAYGPHYAVAPKPPRHHGSTYPPDGVVERAIPAERILTCTGPAGTLLFVDTIGLHKGGYSTKKSRWMFSSVYKTDASTSHRVKCVYPPEFAAFEATLPAAARHAARPPRWFIP